MSNRVGPKKPPRRLEHATVVPIVGKPDTCRERVFTRYCGKDAPLMARWDEKDGNGGRRSCSSPRCPAHAATWASNQRCRILSIDEMMRDD